MRVLFFAACLFGVVVAATGYAKTSRQECQNSCSPQFERCPSHACVITLLKACRRFGTSPVCPLSPDTVVTSTTLTTTTTSSTIPPSFTRSAQFTTGRGGTLTITVDPQNRLVTLEMDAVATLTLGFCGGNNSSNIAGRSVRDGQPAFDYLNFVRSSGCDPPTRLVFTPIGFNGDRGQVDLFSTVTVQMYVEHSPLPTEFPIAETCRP